MKADLTRNTFHSFKHFTRVLMQQGRVQLDADWNEQASILLHYLQTLAADLIGPEGGPKDNLGFGISTLTLAPSDFRIDEGRYYVAGILCEAESESAGFALVTGKLDTVEVDQWTLNGRPFLANQLVEVFDDVQAPGAKPGFPPKVLQVKNADPAKKQLTLSENLPPLSNTDPKLRSVITYLTQPDYPAPSPLTGPNARLTNYLIYLDVWERHITYIEDDSIREVALGGPDTATRAKIVWQVKAVEAAADTTSPPRPTSPPAPASPPNSPPSPCDRFRPTNPDFLANLFGDNRGRLKAKAKRSTTSTDPCIIPPSAQFTGAENQLYRVEIHDPGAAWNGKDDPKNIAAATFKWSRENGSVVFPIVSVAAGGGSTTVTLENLGRDDRFGLEEGDWVEIQDDDYVLQNRAEPLLQVHAIDRSSLKVTLTGAPVSKVGTDPAKHPLLRRWDHKAGDSAEGGLTLASDGAALIEEETQDMWLNLEDGVQIQFQPPDSGQPVSQYRTGDYWLIPARTATGDVEWPTETITDGSGKTAVAHLAKPPDGIDHHYAPLGVIEVSSGKVAVLPGDCRKVFDPLAKNL